MEKAGRLTVVAPTLRIFRDGILFQDIVGTGVLLELIEEVHGTSVRLPTGLIVQMRWGLLESVTTRAWISTCTTRGLLHVRHTDERVGFHMMTNVMVLKKDDLDRNQIQAR